MRTQDDLIARPRHGRISDARPTGDSGGARSARGISRGFLRIFLGLAVLVILVTGASAQVSSSATIRGAIKDQTGAVVPKATVTLINQDTRFERKVTSNDEGLYSFTAVDPGTYSIKVESGQFKTYSAENIRVNPSSTVGQDIRLEVGAATETITVQAQNEKLEKETGAKEDTLTSKQIDNLSIISRSSLELLRILPGVVAPNLDDPAFESLSFGGGANANANYAVNGIRGVDINTSIDGSRVMDIGSNNGSMITANPDMVQEVTIKTSNYAAEHGSSGVQVTATTKGGSSQFHGEVYDYERNHALNANDRSNTLFQISKPASVYHFPGGNISGPVVLPGTNFNKNKDKLFFFFGVEVQRQTVDPGATFDITPTLDQRNGLFKLNGSNTVTHVTADPVGQAFINLYPKPNYTPTAGQDQRLNYINDVLTPTNRTQGIVRVDYNITNNTKMYVRLARESESADQPKGIWWGPSSYELPSHVVGTNLGRSAAVNLTNIINPTMTNEVVFSASRLVLDNNYADPNKLSLSALGIPNFAGPFGQQSKFANPAFITSWSGQTLGDFWNPGGQPLFAHNDSTSVTDNLAKIHGTHTMKFGATFESANKQQNNSASTEGEFIYAGWGANSTGNVFADLLAGHVAQYNQATAIPVGKFRFYNLEVYAQDSWKVKPNFTLEYGLRVAYLPNNYERQGLGVMFSPQAYDHTQGVLINGDPNKPNGILQASLGQIPKGLVGSNAPQWMPRLNFAWDISGKGDTVIRGGAGVFYNRVQGNYQYYSLNQPPNSYSANLNGVTYESLHVTNPFTTLGSIGLTSANPQSNFIPRIATMSLSIARRLPKGTILEVSYVGTEGRHLPDIRESDFVPLGAMLSGHIGNADLSVPVQRWAVSGQGSLVASFRPFPAYTNIKLDEYAATSSYHSLQATLSHQAGKNLQFFANYTFSKALGTTGVNETDGNGVDPLDMRHKSYGILPYDRTHVFNLSYNYNIPDLARGFMANGFTRGLLNGWQMSGISTIQSGVPIRLKFSGDLGGTNAGVAFFGSDAFANTGISASPVAPVFLKNPSLGGNGYNQRIFDLSAIGIPAFGTTGSYESPFYVRSPHRMNHDISFFKNFRITEAKRIQFRAGFFDIFNQAYPRYSQYNGQNLNDINTTLTANCNVHMNHVPNGTGGFSDNVCDPTQGFSLDQNTLNNFGKITNKHGHRVIELAIKFYF